MQAHTTTRRCACGCGQALRTREALYHDDHFRFPQPRSLCDCGCGELAKGGKRFVVGHHQRVAPIPDLLDFFWARVQKSEGCWLWTGQTRTGYGRIHRNGECIVASHLSWEIANGKPFPAGMFACHTCDNPPCVRPDHIFPGTHLDNMRDLFAKGRRPNAWRIEHQDGETNVAAKLTDDSVREIRRLYATGGITQREIGARYGVTQTNVQQILAGKTWVHLL